jgi:hypothetical protein
MVCPLYYVKDKSPNPSVAQTDTKFARWRECKRTLSYQKSAVAKPIILCPSYYCTTVTSFCLCTDSFFSWYIHSSRSVLSLAHLRFWIDLVQLSEGNRVVGLAHVCPAPRDRVVVVPLPVGSEQVWKKKNTVGCWKTKWARLKIDWANSLWTYM